MRFSETLLKTLREAPKDEEAKNAQLLIRAGFVDKLMAGVYSFLPLGDRVIKKIAAIIRSRMAEMEGIELLLPALHNRKPYELTGRWEGMDSLIRFETYHTKAEYALGATHEEIVTPLMKRFIQSYKDLPKAVYQIQTKFRDEKRAKSGLLRGREFLMKDLYSFHADEADLDTYYERMKETYKKIYADVGLADKTYLTFASGGTFAKYSHEFQTLCEAGEDIIYICDHCQLAINKEIIAEQNSCPECSSTELREEKGIEVGNIFKLKTKYSEPFNLNFKNEVGEDKLVPMGCYGIGLSRLMGTVAELLADDKGLVWPEAIAPFKVHLVGLNLDVAEIKEQTDAFYQELSGEGVEVLYDDRLGAQAGEKFADADLIGCPLRVTISKRTLEEKEYELAYRQSGLVEKYPLTNREKLK